MQPPMCSLTPTPTKGRSHHDRESYGICHRGNAVTVRELIAELSEKNLDSEVIVRHHSVGDGETEWSRVYEVQGYNEGRVVLAAETL